MPEITYREALRQALRYQLQNDDRVFLMGEDIGAYGGSYAVTKGFLQEFGEKRVKDTPISESVVVGAGIGAAMAGLKPMVELMTINFSLLAIDQIVNNASKLYYMSNGQINVPLVIRMAGGAGSQLGAQHSHSLEGWYAHVPGIKVVVPATPYDAKGLLMTAFDDDNPVIFIEHTALYASKGDVPEEPYRLPFGQAEVFRQGKDLTLIGYSGSVHQAYRAAGHLADEGIDAEVLNLRTLRPLDVDAIIASVKKTSRAIVIEDDWKFGGFGGEIVALIQERAFDYLDAPVERCSGADVPMPYAGALEQAALPQEPAIVETALRMFEGVAR
ncbi:MAG TPA: alpha-ketoacid dehydrogenase subunit beta [Dehalococcoidia bacterium]|nr:alpha-ketoacid dehydrogenase subunit beta [Dehalococcoidia bacterium]